MIIIKIDSFSKTFSYEGYDIIPLEVSKLLNDLQAELFENDYEEV